MGLKNFLIKHKETAQIAYGVILIILIPLLIVFNSVFIIGRYNKSLDLSLQLKTMEMGRTIYALIKDDLRDEDLLQKKLEMLSEHKVGIEELSILIPSGDKFKIVASTNQDDRNKVRQFYFYNLAWMQSDNDGLATDLLKLSSDEDGNEINHDPNEERFWLAAMPMRDISGNKHSLLSIKLNSAIVDDVTKYNRNASVILLIGTVFIIILFLLIAVRLWDYALLYKKIKEVDRMKDEFIAVASHELRTPVAGIIGYTSMILDGTFGKINKEVKKSLTLVKSAADRLSVLVDDLLNVSRIEQGRFKISLKPLDIRPIIKEVVEELNVQADEKNLKLIFKSHKNKLPLVDIDTDRLKQVLINLIGNAIKYTEEGEVEIIIGEKNNGKEIELKIKDTGIGMSAEERARLFEKFYRVRNEKTQKITGTGLGLWITEKIVRLMNGNILVDSIKNIGTQMTIIFPASKTGRNK